MNQDFDGLEWLRDIRKQIAAEYHYDPKEMGDSYRSLQPKYQSRLLTPDQMALMVGLREAQGFGNLGDGGTNEIAVR